jgi:hypothetical protein
MEAKLGNLKDARTIFDRALKEFRNPPSEAKMGVWDRCVSPPPPPSTPTSPS